MSDISFLAAALASGVTLGMFFFGGLWLTVRKGMLSDQPALWFFVSLLARMSVALTGFYVVSGGRWERLVTCLLGFILARLIVNRLTLPSSAGARETRYAP